MSGGMAQTIYDRSPWFIQNLMVSAYGWKLGRREYGAEFQRCLAEFEKLQWLSSEELRGYQDEQLRRVVAHAFENVPYYRDIMDKRRLKPADIQSVDDLPKLPLLTREDIKANFDALTSRTAKPEDKIVGHTSGTTGSPLEFYYDRNICLMKNVVDWRQKRWAGIDFGSRMALFHGRIVVPLERTRPPFWRYNFAQNHVLFSSFHMSGDNISSYIKQLEKIRPEAVEGYPSTVYIIAKFLLSNGKRLPVKAVFTSSETLFPQQREAIEEAFCTKLYDFYGLAERTVFATECDAHEGHHLNDDFGITEVLDSNGDTVGPGELGRLVVTGLHNYTMPLIRYRTSDVTALRAGICSCGRHFPLMEDVTTKEEDVITTPDGRLISSSILTHPFKPMKYVSESQIIQEDEKTVRIKLVKIDGYSDSDTEYLKTEFAKRLGDQMEVVVEFVDSIPRTKAGKLRWVVSKVALKF